MSPRCEGLPNLPCGRVLSGREGWCLQHGDQEDRDSRWARDGMSKRDIDPLIGATRQVTERLPKPNEDQLAFELDGGHPEDDITAPPKPEITRAPHTRRGGRLKATRTMTPAQEREWAKGMAS